MLQFSAGFVLLILNIFNKMVSTFSKPSNSRICVKRAAYRKGKLLSYISILTIIVLSSEIKAQPMECAKSWGVGAYMQIAATAPLQNSVKAAPGSIISFVLAFNDPDYVTILPPVPGQGTSCSNSNQAGPAEYRPFKYIVNFQVNGFSSFSATGNEPVAVSSVIESKAPTNSPGYVPGEYKTSSEVYLYISPGWSAADGDITVTATIKDLTILDGAGLLTDPDKTFTWTIKHFAECPQSITRVSPTEQISQWVGPDNLLTYYKVVGNLPSSGYAGLLITEDFYWKYDNPFFEFEDLTKKFTREFKIQESNLGEAVKVLFGIGHRVSFIVQSNGVFSDEHSSKFIEKNFLGKMKKWFTESSIMTNKVGFWFGQTYMCSGALLPTTIPPNPTTTPPIKIAKLYEYDAATEENIEKVQKSHTF